MAGCLHFWRPCRVPDPRSLCAVCEPLAATCPLLPKSPLCLSLAPVLREEHDRFWFPSERPHRGVLGGRVPGAGAPSPSAQRFSMGLPFLPEGSPSPGSPLPTAAAPSGSRPCRRSRGTLPAVQYGSAPSDGHGTALPLKKPHSRGLFQGIRNSGTVLVLRVERAAQHRPSFSV